MTDIIWNYASVIASGLAGLILTLLIGSYFGPSTLGAFNFIFAVYIISSQVASFGIHHSVLKYIAENSQDTAKRKVVLSSGILITSFIALMVSASLWLAGSPVSTFKSSPDLDMGFKLAAIGVFFFALNKVLLAALNAFSRLKEYAAYNTLRYLLLIVSLVAVILAGNPLNNIAIILPFSEAALSVLLFQALSSEIRLKKLADLKQWLLTHFHFGLRAVGGNVVLDLNTRVDILVLSFFVDDYSVGIYSMAAILAEAIYQLPIVLRVIYGPRIIEMLARHSLQPILDLVQKLKQRLWCSMAVISVIGCMLYSKAVPILSGNPEYASGAIAFTILMTGVTIASGYAPFGLIFNYSGHPKAQTAMSTLLVLTNFIGNLLLIPFWGIEGAATATTLAHISFVFLLKHFSKTLLHLKI